MKVFAISHSDSTNNYYVSLKYYYINIFKIRGYSIYFKITNFALNIDNESVDKILTIVNIKEGKNKRERGEERREVECVNKRSIMIDARDLFIIICVT